MMTNQRRKNRARRAMSHYKDSEDQTNMVDMLSDLRLLADEVGVDFGAALKTSAMHYEAERRGNPDRVSPDQACPGCGERRSDSLVWQNDDEVRCHTCGRTYAP